MIDAIRSEWIKVSTIRVTWILAARSPSPSRRVTVLTALFSEDLPTVATSPASSPGSTVVSAMLLGVVVQPVGITNEFSHGTIRPTFAAMPDRLRPLLAKPIVQVTIAVVVTVGDRRRRGGSVGGGHGRGHRSRSTTDGALPALIGVVLLAVGPDAARVRARPAHAQQRGDDLHPAPVAADRRGPRSPGC